MLRSCSTMAGSRCACTCMPGPLPHHRLLFPSCNSQQDRLPCRCPSSWAPQARATLSALAATTRSMSSRCRAVRAWTQLKYAAARRRADSFCVPTERCVQLVPDLEHIGSAVDSPARALPVIPISQPVSASEAHAQRLSHQGMPCYRPSQVRLMHPVHASPLPTAQW